MENLKQMARDMSNLAESLRRAYRDLRFVEAISTMDLEFVIWDAYVSAHNLKVEIADEIAPYCY